MSSPNPSTAFAGAIMDELALQGVELVAAAPGSRSTALVLAAARHPRLDLSVLLDERSAAFHALGWSKRTGRAAAVLTTSGTAVANLTPAVVEADISSVPLLVLSADRPPEMRGVGANQAIDQAGMFDRFVRLSLDMGPGEATDTASRYWRSSVSRAVASSYGFGGRPGPVHLNLAFREPTVPVSDDGRSRAGPFPHDVSGRDGGWAQAESGRSVDRTQLDRIVDLVGRSRGVIVAGSGVGYVPSIVDLGRHLGWPVLATAESGLRHLEGVIATGHHLVELVAPDAILRFGGPGPSRRMTDLISGDIPQIVVAPVWTDPGRGAFGLVDADPASVVTAVEETAPARQPDGWWEWWERADLAVRSALVPELERSSITEPAMAAVAARLDTDVLTVASSMPIRDIESYAFEVGRLVANRGASGIDGFVSTSLGAARHASRALALTGDLSLLHDSNGFMVDPRPSCVFLVVDNRGGGIFSFLPQAQHARPDFERLFATPPERDLEKLAGLHHLGFARVNKVEDVPEAVEEAWSSGGCHLVVGETDRAENVAEHARLNRLAEEAAGEVPRTPAG